MGLEGICNCSFKNLRLDNLISATYEIEYHWAGVRPTVSDRRPILGQNPGSKNIYIFNGLGTKGVMLAPYFAKEMMKCLGDSGYCLDAEVDVRRFTK